MALRRALDLAEETLTATAGAEADVRHAMTRKPGVFVAGVAATVQQLRAR